MPAQTRKEFVERWEDHIDQVALLGNSTNKLSTWEEIKTIQEDARRLIHKIANEAFGVKESPISYFDFIPHGEFILWEKSPE